MFIHLLLWMAKSSDLVRMAESNDRETERRAYILPVIHGCMVAYGGAEHIVIGS